MSKNVKFEDEKDMKSVKDSIDVVSEIKEEKEKSVENYLADSNIDKNENE